MGLVAAGADAMVRLKSALPDSLARSTPSRISPYSAVSWIPYHQGLRIDTQCQKDFEGHSYHHSAITMSLLNDADRLETEAGAIKPTGTTFEVEVDSDIDNTLRGWLHDSFQFRKETLDRQLDRSQITGTSFTTHDTKLETNETEGIAFSGAVGIGLFVTCAQIITLSGPVGAILSFSLAGLVIVSVMRSLAKMVSVRPVKGPLMDYPATFVDEALGVAVGIVYW
jgi:hypothetical protein